MKKLITFFKYLLATIIASVALYGVYQLLPQRTIMFGAWTEGFYDAETRTLHPEELQSFEKRVNKKAAIAHYYRGWEALERKDLLDEFATLRSNGWQPMLNSNPYYVSECEYVKGKTLYRAIADGHCDVFLRKAGANLAKVDEPFFFLFAWEMNNKDLEWSIKQTGSSGQDFVDAWRHMHDIFEEEGATNILWVFCPNTQDKNSISYADIYPGDDYVDWVGIDGYNWGETQSWSDWSSFSGVFTASYRNITAVAPDKPVMIAEFNSTDVGGNKANWYKEALEEEIPYRFPHIKAIVIYDEDRTEQEKVNWKVDVSEESLEAFKQSIQIKYYNSN